MIKTQLNFNYKNYPYAKDTLRLGFYSFTIMLDFDFKVKKGDVFDPFTFFTDFPKMTMMIPKGLNDDEKLLLEYNMGNLLLKYDFYVDNISYYSSTENVNGVEKPYIVSCVNLAFNEFPNE